MKVTNHGSADINQLRLDKTDRVIAPQGEKERKKVGRADEAVQISISSAARRQQKVAALAQREAELRAQKLARIKDQIVQGKYHVNAADLAKAILRDELSQLLRGRTKPDKS